MDTPALTRRQMLIASLVASAALLGTQGALAVPALGQEGQPLTEEEQRELAALVEYLDSGAFERLEGGAVVVEGWVLSTAVQDQIRSLHSRGRHDTYGG